MFTGLIEDVSTLGGIKRKEGAFELTIKTGISIDEIKEGDSIAVNGICLTVTSLNRNKSTFNVEAVAETGDVTTISQWRTGKKLNLERALAFGGRLDGHLVAGHVDGTGRVVKISRRGKQVTISILAPDSIKTGLIKKGSIAVDGVSLTVAELSGARFDVAVIPYTIEKSTLKLLLTGDKVNLESDLIAKHIANNMKSFRR
jgi:riboflavin synthase